jgi:hypothetical protein
MNLVEKTMETLGLKTLAELSRLSKVSEKTLTGWKKNLPSYAEAILNLLIENHNLKKELQVARDYKKAVAEFMSAY